MFQNGEQVDVEDDVLEPDTAPRPELRVLRLILAGQRIFVVRRDDYVYLVPFVEDEQTVFVKTISPSRKATKEYLGGVSDHEDGR
jgi:hypothetical protein